MRPPAGRRQVWVLLFAALISCSRLMQRPHVCGGGDSPTLYTAVILFVTVSRRTVTQPLHPCACSHCSRCSPRGFLRMKRYSPHSSSASVSGVGGRTMCASPPQENSVSSRGPHHGHSISSIGP